jgi:hypothetical protein
MSRVIWKYPVDIIDKQIIEMPQVAKILCVQIQGQSEEIFIWAEVITENNKLEKRIIRVFGTGTDIPEFINLKYMGTIQERNFSVYHFFEEVK